MTSNIQDVYIVSGVRTPIAAFRGSFASLNAVDLGTVAAKEALSRAGVRPADVDETVTGSVLTAGNGQNVSRQIAIKAGIPESQNAYTINKVCSSSLKALMLATQSIQLGCRNTCLVVGVESMSQCPFYLSRGEHGYGDVKLVDGIQRDGISDATLNDPMGLCAEKTAKEYQITRQCQDQYALSSYERAAETWKNGDFQAEIVPVSVKQRRGPDVVVSEDEEFKRLVKEKVPTLGTAFSKDGTITAANASSLNDGAAALVVVSGSTANSAGLKPLARVVAYAEAGRAPVDFTIAPVDAVRRLLEVAKVPKEKVARWEVNEAFSVTALAFIKELGLDRNVVNVRGGAVALGHPIGMSGARIVVTLMHQLKPNEYGVAAICNGGGEATAVLIQKC
jgi:acetyl-CoA C-acetyltransferase